MAPRIPELPAIVREACPPARLIEDTSLAALVTADALLAGEYARCQAKHAAAVQAYDDVRKILLELKQP